MDKEELNLFEQMTKLFVFTRYEENENIQEREKDWEKVKEYLDDCKKGKNE